MRGSYLELFFFLLPLFLAVRAGSVTFLVENIQGVTQTLGRPLSKLNIGQFKETKR